MALWYETHERTYIYPCQPPPRAEEARMSEQKVSSSAAAMQAQLSAEQLRRRILRGEIKGQLIGGRYVVDAASLAAWIAENRQPAPAA